MTKNEQNIGRNSVISQASSKVTEKVGYGPGEKTITREFERGHGRPLSSIMSKSDKSQDV